MKRKSPSHRAGAHYLPVLANFSPQQLAGIGAVAMTFNDAERALHELLGPCLRWPTHYEIVASRINGMEGIAAIIRMAAKNLIRLDAARVQMAIGFWKDLDLTLDAFLEVKRFRDGVLHANIFDVHTAVGTMYASQDSTHDVLLTVEALKWLTDTCIVIAEELRAWENALEAGSILMHNYSAAGPERAPLEQAVLDAVVLAKSYRPRRQSLGPAPKVPLPPAIS
jgi:hypothetical protein